MGERIPIEIIRKGERQSIELEIGELESSGLVAGSAAPPSRDWVLGMKLKALEDMDEAERERDRLPESGLLVEELKAGAARSAGVRKGDILLMFNNKAVKDLRQLRRLARELPRGAAVALLVQRGDFSFFMVLKTE